MPRSIWNGVVSFGMVSIPVKLYTATDNKDISFNQLHKTCGSRIKQQRWCPTNEKVVDYDEIQRGYEYARDQYVVLSEEDFEKIPLPSKHTIELAAFVKDDEIDPIFYEKSYYLEPDETGIKPFALLMRALKKKGPDRRRQAGDSQQGAPLRSPPLRRHAHARNALLPGRGARAEGRGPARSKRH